MSALVETDDETTRQIRAREGVATAHALLVDHVPRDQRVAEALALARANIARHDYDDPKRVLERQAELWRRQRIQRSRDAAMETLERTAHLEPRSPVSSKIVRKIKENARVAPEAPDPKSEPPQRERRLDTAPIDWEARICEAIQCEREFQAGVLALVIADAREDLERAIQSVSAEVADLKATLAELRLAVADERGKTLDLPNPLRSHRAN